ncbi:sphingomyelin phosphodiesterase 4 [Centruroides vittatus]|uniref:sphingomyelin phosphodiesterase 4 n=1 Tax=Centruroides vittatus TaxID=120091 RepID=UPI0035104AA0
MAAVSIQLQKILEYPLPQRCSELTRLIGETSLKDLQTLYPLIIESLFGFSTSGTNIHNGWGLSRITSLNRQRDFESLRHFLGPDGPLLNLAYRLPIFGDGQLKYEFPFSCLPASTRHMLEEGAIPMFYSNKFHYQNPGRLPSSVLLNPFEYYFFHFAYFIINPQQQQHILVHPSEALYSCLLEDYLHAFLPVGDNVTFPFSFTPTLQHKFPLSQYSGKGFSTSGIPHSHHSSSPPYHHSLLKQSPTLLKITTSPSSSKPNPGTTVDSEHFEIWRSETLVLVLTEFWLNHGSVESYRSCFSPNLMTDSVSWSPDTTTPVSSLFVEHPIPSHDHMQMVRNFIKYLHYFANSARPINSTSGYAYEQMNGMEILKCTVLQQFVQKRLYTFLRHTFDKWPLDASFRLPLETWLSYIQPWRYTNLSGDKHLTKEEEQGQPPNARWQKFISENLLFYTTIFQQLLPRFLRMELTSPKNAYMLFRVTKVFSQPGLSSMIEEVESTLQEPLSRLTSSHNWPIITEVRTPLRPARDMTVAGTLRQQFLEIEGPGFNFVPLFGDEVRKQINLLLISINQAKDNSAKTLDKNGETKKGLFSYFTQLFSISYDIEGNEDYSQADNKKLEQYLKTSSDQLCAIIHPQTLSSQHIQSQSKAFEKVSTNLPPDTIVEDEKPKLTDLGRYQILNKLRKVKVSYQGHPDLQPIRSYEITFLVRLLWHISLFLNEKFETEFSEAYYRPGFFGKLSRQILAPPAVYYEMKKTGQYSRQISHHLPPRVNLRWLAHKQTVGYLCAYFLFAFMYGYGSFSAILILIFFITIVIVFKSLFTNIQVVSPSSRETEVENQSSVQESQDENTYILQNK